MIAKIQRKILFSLLIFFIAAFSLFLILEILNLNKIARGMAVANFKIGGMKTIEAENILKEKFADWENISIILNYENKQFSVKPAELGIALDLEKTFNSAYNFGREKNILSGLFKQIKLLLPLTDKNLAPSFSFNERNFDQFIQKKFAGAENPAQNASLLYDIQKRDWETTPAKQGKTFDRKKIKTDLEKRINNLNSSAIELVLIDDYPEIIENETQRAKEKANLILNSAPYSIKFNSKSWKIDRQTLLDWIKFIPVDEDNKSSSNNMPNKILGVVLNQEKIKDVLIVIAPSINQEPVNAQLALKDGKVIAFALSEDGLRLDIDQSAEKIENEILNKAYSSSPSTSSGQAGVEKFSTPNNPSDSTGQASSNNKSAEDNKNIELVVIKKPPIITTENIDTLGLTSLLGAGTSNFAGSPKNRMHNIRIGAAKFDGVLLKPNEEFSFAKIINEIGPKQGYLPELVIKKNKTIPEYGGGICQVSTTAFRAAVNSGLKITERYPHAFPVKYYNPQGFDSTVYPPHPDLRFINDTPNNILIQTKIEGTKLFFELYGTSDTREVKIKGPTILESNPNGSMKTILYQEIWRDGKIERQDKFFSNYKSPDLYPVERNPLE